MTTLKEIPFDRVEKIANWIASDDRFSLDDRKRARNLLDLIFGMRSVSADKEERDKAKPAPLLLPAFAVDDHVEAWRTYLIANGYDVPTRVLKRFYERPVSKRVARVADTYRDYCEFELMMRIRQLANGPKKNRRVLLVETDRTVDPGQVDVVESQRVDVIAAYDALRAFVSDEGWMNDPKELKRIRRLRESETRKRLSERKKRERERIADEPARKERARRDAAYLERLNRS